MFRFSAVFFCVLAAIVTGYIKRPRDICAGNDVSKDPRLEGRQRDGWWYTQGVLTQRFPSNSIFLFQFQGKAAWGNDWNTTTKACTYRKFDETQRQSLTLGPFSPCVSSIEVSDTGEDVPIGDYLYWMPTEDILMLYACLAEVRPNGFCTEPPFARLLTRNIDITRRQLRIVKRKLRSLGVSLDSLSMVNARENRCPLPPKIFSGPNKGNYTRTRQRY